jgi:hypothetical protein
MSLGAGFQSEKPREREPKRPLNIQYPFSNQHVYHSQASLVGVHSIECFLIDTERGGLARPCVGVILEYSNGRRASLGECRVGISKSIYIISPTMLHLKPAAGESLHSGAWFTSSAGEAEELQSLGWERRQMNGTITWWFGVNVIEIVHSSDTVIK